MKLSQKVVSKFDTTYFSEAVYKLLPCQFTALLHFVLNKILFHEIVT